MSLNQMLSPELGRRIVSVSGLTVLDGNGWVISLFPSVLEHCYRSSIPSAFTEEHRQNGMD